MVEIIQHRVNRISKIKDIVFPFGAELDIRSDINKKGRLVVTHDPWSSFEDLDEWFFAWKDHGSNGILIFNTKEDGLESDIINMAEKYDIKNYFFLDTAMPTLIKWTFKHKNPNFALRFSQYEGIDISFINKVKWLWVDCFDGNKPQIEKLIVLKNFFKLCLVSPELQGFSFDNEWLMYANIVDAICTKNSQLWIKSI